MPVSKSRSRRNLEAQLGPPSRQQPAVVAQSPEGPITPAHSEHRIQLAGIVGATPTTNTPVDPGGNAGTPAQSQVAAEAAQDIEVLNSEGAFQAPLTNRVSSAIQNAPSDLSRATKQKAEELKRKAAGLKAAASKFVYGSKPSTSSE